MKIYGIQYRCGYDYHFRRFLYDTHEKMFASKAKAEKFRKKFALAQRMNDKDVTVFSVKVIE